MYVDRQYLNTGQTRREPGYGSRHETCSRSSYHSQDASITVGKGYFYRRKDSAKERTGLHQRDKRKLRDGARFLLKDGSIIDPNKCIVCCRFGCHSSKHRNASKAFIAAIDEASSASDTSTTVNTTLQTDLDAPRGNESKSYACFFVGCPGVLFTKFDAYSSYRASTVGAIVNAGTSRLSTVGMCWMETYV